ncbi:MAG: hypothetical protein PWR10_1835 [Halanaerobiales bacterium]|nr:hypothetical protein [Halanaerobiales bacterium]
MAHLRKRGNSWQICIEAGVDPATGKRKRIYKTVNGTKREAEKVMHQLAHKVETGQYIKPSEITLKEYLLKWIKNYGENNLAPRTYESYKRIIKNHLIPFLGQLKMKEIKPMHIVDYQNYKIREGRLDGKGGLSKRTVQYHHRILSEALKHAVMPYRILESNPCASVSAPVPDKPEINPLDQEQLTELLKAAKNENEWTYNLIYVAAFTGMRRGEILALRWKDVDFISQKLHVRQGVVNVDGQGLIFKKPKTKSSIRPIDVDNDVIAILKKIKKHQTENRLKIGPAYDNKHNLVFTHEDGAPVLPQLATRRFNQAAKKANLEGFRFHDLRHTHATMLLKAGVHPKVVQERLGHSSITITIDTYSHVLPSMQKEALEKLKMRLK